VVALGKRDAPANKSSSREPPDDVCDRICDSDALAQVGSEALATTNRIVLAGEVRAPGLIAPDMLIEVAQRAILQIGYEHRGFDCKHASIDCYLRKGGLVGKDQGSADQSIIFGYICRETPNFIPAPIFSAQAVLESIVQAGQLCAAPQLGPNVKSQISVQYVAGKLARVSSMVVSTTEDEAIGRDVYFMYRSLQTVFGGCTVKVSTFGSRGPIAAEVMIFPAPTLPSKL
jgi:S-adenosylmethionine synthetase